MGVKDLSAMTAQVHSPLYRQNQAHLAVHLAEIVRGVAAVIGVQPQAAAEIIRRGFQTGSPRRFAYALLRSRANQPASESGQVSLSVVETVLLSELKKRGDFDLSVGYTDDGRLYYSVIISIFAAVPAPPSVARMYQNIGMLFYDQTCGMFDIVYQDGRRLGGLLPGRSFEVEHNGGWVKTQLQIDACGRPFFVGFASTGLPRNTLARI